MGERSHHPWRASLGYGSTCRLGLTQNQVRARDPHRILFERLWRRPLYRPAVGVVDALVTGAKILPLIVVPPHLATRVGTPEGTSHYAILVADDFDGVRSVQDSHPLTKRKLIERQLDDSALFGSRILSRTAHNRDQRTGRGQHGGTPQQLQGGAPSSVGFAQVDLPAAWRGSRPPATNSLHPRGLGLLSTLVNRRF